MSYEILKSSVSGNSLPLIMEINKLNPQFIDDFLISPIINYKTNKKDEKDSEQYSNITPEQILISLISPSNKQDKSDISFIYEKLKAKNYSISNKGLIKLLDSYNILNFDEIFKDNIEEISSILNKRETYDSSSYAKTLFFIDKKSVDFAKYYFLKSGDSINSIMKKAKVKHISEIAKLIYSLDMSKTEDEYSRDIYAKMLKKSFNQGTRERYSNFYESEVSIFKNLESSYDNFMFENMPKMTENEIYKSLILGFRDKNIKNDVLNKVLKKLKINKNSIEYANLVTDSLDIQTRLVNFKKEFYYFPDVFWSKKNLLTASDSDLSSDSKELSRGMKLLLDMDINEINWNEKSISKVKDIYMKKIMPHIQAIYEDYINRRCFELPETQQLVQKITKKDISNYNSNYNDKYCMEDRIDLKKFVESYINVKDKNNITENEYKRIKDIVDFYTQKLSSKDYENQKNDDSIENINHANKILVKGNFTKEYLVSVNNHTYPNQVFNVLSDYKDIVLNVLKNNKSALDNNLVFVALNLNMISDEDLLKADYKLTYSSLNTPTENDLQNIHFARQAPNKKLSSKLMISSLSLHGLKIKDLLTNYDIIMENMELEEKIPKFKNNVNKVIKF